MARSKLTLTCTRCGCEFEHIHFSRNRSDANSYEDWAYNNITVCPSCYAAERLESYIASFGEHRLPEIVGVSDKQIAYASKLRSTFVEFELLRRHNNLNIPQFFELWDVYQVKNLDATKIDQAKEMAAQDGKSLEEWVEYNRRKTIKDLFHLSEAELNKILLIFTEENASKLIDALKSR